MKLKKEFYFTEFEEKEFHEIQDLWEQTGMGDSERDDNALTILNCNKHGGKLIVMKDINSNEINAAPKTYLL